MLRTTISLRVLSPAPREGAVDSPISPLRIVATVVAAVPAGPFAPASDLNSISRYPNDIHLYYFHVSPSGTHDHCC